MGNMGSARCALLLLSAATAALAQTCVADTTAGTTTCTYATQGQDATFTVPLLVTSVDLQVVGGRAGSSSRGGAGGNGALVSLDGLTVVPGSTLNLCVLCAIANGADGSFVGQNGGLDGVSAAGLSSTALDLKTGGGTGGFGEFGPAGGGALRPMSVY